MTKYKNPPRMWAYWKNDKGVDNAISEYYSDLFEQDEVLRSCLHKVKMCMFVIDKRMQELAEEEQDDDY